MIRRVAAVALVAAVASPVVRDPESDSFPLSTYPMFTHARGRSIELVYAIGATATGDRRAIAPELVGTQEVLQAHVVIDGAVSTGHAAELCAEIAGRVPRDSDIATVRIVHGRHDTVALVTDGALGLELDYARCEVRR